MLRCIFLGDFDAVSVLRNEIFVFKDQVVYHLIKGK